MLLDSWSANATERFLPVLRGQAGFQIWDSKMVEEVTDCDGWIITEALATVVARKS